MNIPFHKPWYDRRDEQALVAALRSGRIVGDGDCTRAASERLADLLGRTHVLLTTSCSHALELAMMVLRIQPGDEVIVPSFTFVSTTNCILRQGARIVFADIRPDTLTLDVTDMERRITPATRAIVPIVYAGVPPDMDAIYRVARPRAIPIVEDAAQGLGVKYQGRPAGTLGDIGCLSFHETKNLSTGEGGAFITNNDELAARAEIMREKGTNRKQFLQGLIDKYTWVEVGSSFLPSDLTAALLLSQLEKLSEITTRRQSVHRHYMEAFAPLADKGCFTLPHVPDGVTSNHHIFYVLLEDEQQRNKAIEFFRSRGVGTTFHYLPLHLSSVGRSLGYHQGDCPVTESVSGRLLRLPIYPALAKAEIAHVVTTMTEFFT